MSTCQDCLEISGGGHYILEAISQYHNILVATHTKSNTMHPVFRTHTWREVAVHLLDLLKVAQLFVGEGRILPVMLGVDSSGNEVQWACDVV